MNEVGIIYYDWVMAGRLWSRYMRRPYVEQGKLRSEYIIGARVLAIGSTVQWELPALMSAMAATGQMIIVKAATN